MDFLHAIILGIIEGITEFLPISSTGHLIITSELLNLETTEFLKSFEIIIQLGAILAVVWLYWRSFLDLRILKKLAIAFLPTAIIGLVLYKYIKQYLLGNNGVVLWALLVGGILLIVFEKLHKQRQETENVVSDISYEHSFLIGLFQAVAMIPGVSRSAATILGGLGLGIKRELVVEFSFLLAVPTMIAASGLDFAQSYESIFSGNILILLVGFVISFLVALASIKYFLKYVRRKNLMWFGVYRILIAIVFWIIIF